MIFSVTTGNIDLAVLNVQNDLGKVTKNAENHAFSKTKPFKYISLDNLRESLQPHLKENDLIFTITSDTKDGVSGFTWRLSHVSSGEFYMGFATANAKGNTPQDYGSAQTYLNRYILVGLFGVQTDEDDDGNRASLSPSLIINSPEWKEAVEALKNGTTTKEELLNKYTIPESLQRVLFKN